MTRRVLVTGASGYIGSKLMEHLRTRGDVEIRGLDLLSEGNADVAEVDLRDETSTVALIREFSPHVVMHLAALHLIPDCERYPKAVHATNVNGTLNLVQACDSRDLCRFIFASSAAVYSGSAAVCSRETDQCAPLTVYGTTKLQAEECIRQQFRERVSTLALRLFNIYGLLDPNGHVVPTFLREVLQSGTLSYGNVSSIRDFVYIEDVLATLEWALDCQECPSAVNVGTGDGTSIGQLVDLIESINGPTLRRQLPSLARDLDPPRLVASVELLRKWMPQSATFRGLEDGLGLTVPLYARITQQRPVALG
jgi:UDP-glucose 4-epimerase